MFTFVLIEPHHTPKNVSKSEKQIFEEERRGRLFTDLREAGVNFINILKPAFWYERVIRNFSLLSLWFVFIFFCQKEIGKKLLVKYR